MPNKNYIRGRALEYRIKKEMEQSGWVVVRASGSHSFADLVGIREDEQGSVEIQFIQLKRRKDGKSSVVIRREFYAHVQDILMTVVDAKTRKRDNKEDSN